MKLRQVLVGLVAVMLLAGLLHEAQASHDNFCYLVADQGNLLTQVDTTDFDPATNETNIGTGTGVSFIETIAFQPGPGPGTIGPLYAADAGQLGTLSLITGLFTPTSSTFGTGGGSLGSITFSDVDGLAFDTFTGTLYGSHRRSAAGVDDLLFQINPSTGAHIPDAFGAGIDYVVIVSFSVTGFSDIDDISINPSNGLMFASANNGGAGDRLVRIDVSTGAVTDIAAFGVDDIEGLSFDDSGQLWGTTGSFGAVGGINRLWEISLTTGAAINPRPLDNGADYESVACHKTLSTTPTPTNTPPPGATLTPTPPATTTPPIVDPSTDVAELPDTGFAPGRVSVLPAPSAEIRYRSLGDLWLEVPGLGIQIPIVGVPLQEQGWDVTQLWDQAGYLEGTAFPTWAGNTALSAHVYLSDGTPGPFVRLGELLWGDEVIIHAFGQRYRYEVREVTSVRPDDLSVLRHEEYDWVTLITCQGYDEQQDAYRSRMVVRAVLVEVTQP